MQTMGLRLNGSTESIDTVLDALRRVPGVDRVEELGMDARAGQDDSSSAGLPDDVRSDSRGVEVHAVSEPTAEAARNRAEIAARDAGVVIEWLEPF